MSSQDIDIPLPALEAELQLDLSGAPLPVKELALGCARFVYTTLKIHLDGTSDTLPLLDHYLGECRAETTQKPEIVPIVAQAVGVYLGEVVRARLGGFWRLPAADDASTWELCSTEVFLALKPVAMAYDALFESVEHPGPKSELRLAQEDQPLVKERLDNLPAVSEEDYFLLSTRFDVIEIAFAALKDHAVADGLGDVTFGPEDYS